MKKIYQKTDRKENNQEDRNKKKRKIEKAKTVEKTIFQKIKRN